MAISLAEQLRVVGQWLDYHGADEFDVDCTRERFTIRGWHHATPVQVRWFTPDELEVRSAAARSSHQNPFGPGRSHWSVFLRNLGQVWPGDAGAPQRVQTQTGRLQIDGQLAGVPTAQWYDEEWLQQANQGYRTQAFRLPTDEPLA